MSDEEYRQEGINMQLKPIKDKLDYLEDRYKESGGLRCLRDRGLIKEVLQELHELVRGLVSDLQESNSLSKATTKCYEGKLVKNLEKLDSKTEKKERCEICGGSGMKEGITGLRDCPKCKGTGIAQDSGGGIESSNERDSVVSDSKYLSHEDDSKLPELCSLCGSPIGDVDVCPICTGKKTEPKPSMIYGDGPEPEPIDCFLCKYYSLSDRSMLCVECVKNGYSKYTPKEKTEPEKDYRREMKGIKYFSRWRAKEVLEKAKKDCDNRCQKLIEEFQKILQEAHRKLNNVRVEIDLSNYLIKQIEEYAGRLKK